MKNRKSFVPLTDPLKDAGTVAELNGDQDMRFLLGEQASIRICILPL